MQEKCSVKLVAFLFEEAMHVGADLKSWIFNLITEMQLNCFLCFL